MQTDREEQYKHKEETIHITDRSLPSVFSGHRTCKEQLLWHGAGQAAAALPLTPTAALRTPHPTGYLWNFC